MENRKPVTLSRRELYKLVWEKPTLTLSKEFGISDVAIGKLCRRHGIPKPPRGNWAKPRAARARIKRPDLSWKVEQQVRITITPTVRDTEPDHCDDRLLERFDRVAALHPIKSDAKNLHPLLSQIKLPPDAELRDGFFRQVVSSRLIIDVTPEGLPRSLCLLDHILRCTDELGWSLGRVRKGVINIDNQRYTSMLWT
jgi:hypothetical protein